MSKLSLYFAFKLNLRYIMKCLNVVFGSSALNISLSLENFTCPKSVKIFRQKIYNILDLKSVGGGEFDQRTENIPDLDT